MSFPEAGESKSRCRLIAIAFGPPAPEVAGLDMRHRIPGLLGRFGGNVAVIANR